MPVFTPAILGSAAAAMSIGTGIAGAVQGGGQQPGQIPGPEGNPMLQGPMGPQQQQPAFEEEQPMPGLPGGGGWYSR